MKTPNASPTGGVVNSLFLLTLFMLAYMAAIGFGTVWLRHEISVTANLNKALEPEITDVQQRLTEVTAEVAFAQGPEQLQRQNQLLGLGLVRPREEQVVRTADDVERQLAARRFGQLLTVTEPERAAPKGGH